MATSYTNDVFYYWVSSSGDTATTTATPTSNVWYKWHTNAITTSTGTDSIWEGWNTAENYKVEAYRLQEPVISRIITSPKKTSERKRAEVTQAKINKMWRDLRIQEEKERKERAELTAQELLLDLIGEQDLAYYRETGRLLVKGRKYDYVVKRNGGVYKVEKGKVIDLCIHLRHKYKYPETDNVIGLLLMIKAEESVFLKTANSHGELRNDKLTGEILELVEKAA